MKLNKFFSRAVDRSLVEDWDGAISDINKALLLEHGGRPNDASLYSLRASLWVVKGDFDRALADLTRSIEIDAKPSYYGERARILAQKGDLDQALIDAEKAIELEPANYVSHQIRGEVRVARKEFELAIADFTESVDLDDSCLAAFDHRAATYRILGKDDLAAADEEQIAIKKAKNRESYSSMVNNIIAMAPHEPLGYVWRGKMHLDRSEFDLAIEDLSRALELGSKDPDTLRFRAQAYRSLDKIDLAETDEKTFESAIQDRKAGFEKKTK